MGKTFTLLSLDKLSIPYDAVITLENNTSIYKYTYSTEEQELDGIKVLSLLNDGTSTKRYLVENNNRYKRSIEKQIKQLKKSVLLDKDFLNNVEVTIYQYVWNILIPVMATRFNETMDKKKLTSIELHFANNLNYATLRNKINVTSLYAKTVSSAIEFAVTISPDNEHLGIILQKHIPDVIIQQHSTTEITTAFDEIIDLLDNDEKRNKIMDQLKEKEKEQNIKKISEITLYHLQRKIEDLRRNRKEQLDKIESIRNTLSIAITNLKNIDITLNGLNQGSSYLLIEAEKIFKSISRLRKVETIDHKNTTIEIYTSNLYATDPRTKLIHDIGKFCIEIDISCNSVKMFNLSGTVDAYEREMQSPHIFSDGRPCFGNAESTISELLGEGKFAELIIVCIKFIESVNVDDSAGKYVHLWPLKKGSNPNKDYLRYLKELNNNRNVKELIKYAESYLEEKGKNNEKQVAYVQATTPTELTAEQRVAMRQNNNNNHSVTGEN